MQIYEEILQRNSIGKNSSLYLHLKTPKQIVYHEKLNTPPNELSR